MKSIVTLLAILAIMALVSCGGGANEPAGNTTGASDTPAVEVAGKVGIVLPTKDEPRWVQDETRFKEALQAAGYDVEILFSQGDSAKEKANVEDLITKGVQVIIITPHDGTA
ncbi:MAG: substrate-binding domain-containing protein, partial [Anaerolinea sp.]|nr:substrate-binding domain-containing protein [Anaerolinea sp.]